MRINHGTRGRGAVGTRTRSFGSRGMRAPVAALFCGLLLACTSSPTPRFYSLPSLDRPDAARSEDTPASGVQLAVAVGPLHMPRYLERPQMVLRHGESRLEFDEMNRWAGSLESETLRVLGENLAILLATDRIVVYPLVAGFPTKYRVRLYIDRFDGRPGEALELRVRWELMSTAQEPDAVAVEVTNLREPLDGSGADELVRAHGKLLADLSRRIAARIEALEAASPPQSDPVAPVS